MQFLNASESSRRLDTTYFCFQHVVITASQSDYSMPFDPALDFMEFLNSMLSTAVYSGNATLVFREELKAMAVENDTLPTIVAVVTGDFIPLPSASPSVMVHLDSSNSPPSSAQTVNAALLAGVVVGLVGLLCITIPVYILIRKEAKKNASKQDKTKTEGDVKLDSSHSRESVDNTQTTLDCQKLSIDLRKAAEESEAMKHVSKSVSDGNITVASVVSKHARESAEIPFTDLSSAMKDGVEANGVKNTPFSTYYDMFSDKSAARNSVSHTEKRNPSPHNSVKEQEPIIPTNFRTDPMDVYDSRLMKDSHFDNPMKYSNRAGAASASAALRKDANSKSAVFGISDFYPKPAKYEDSAANAVGAEQQDSLRFSKFLVEHASNDDDEEGERDGKECGGTLLVEEQVETFSTKNRVSDNEVKEGSIDLVEGNGNGGGASDAHKKGHRKYEIVDSVSDLMKTYKRNPNINIYDIYSDDDKYSPPRPPHTEIIHPNSEPPLRGERRRSTLRSHGSLKSLSSDSYDSTGNAPADPSLPHSQRFKAIKIKFETMIQKNTKTLLMSPRESKSKLMSSSCERENSPFT